MCVQVSYLKYDKLDNFNYDALNYIGGKSCACSEIKNLNHLAHNKR